MLKRNEGNVKKVKGDNQYNGFTLAELLAVITVLAIIALIIFPIMKDVVSDSKRKAFEDSVYGLMKSIEMDYQNDDSFGDRSYSYENGKLVLTDLQGEVMDQSIKVEGIIENGVGEMYIDVKGNVSLTVYNDEWCAVKDYEDRIIKIEEKTDRNCKMPTPAYCFLFEESSRTITNYYEPGIDERCTTDVVIPSMINGIKVEHIGEGAFDRKSLTSVVLPNTIITIGNGSFQGNKLTNLVIPDSVKSIASWAFFRNSLETVNFGNSIQEIGIHAFQGHFLTSITIPSSVKRIGDYAFSCYQHIEKLNVIYEDENNLPEIGYNAFDPSCYVPG